ncbi:HD domain-containing protein [Desulfosporosinus fructosivorans]|uniref:HD domain-containing protein n=1 Tax=Desulfosporosinus fructosivorans TaxID=2018669 RepID=A0A4Z0RAL4_9FIRM|nr:NTP transferase domain-containing protein [Desulfosporosinus fructosivorans]TGE39319.1 HD domain-containing protein [Desulfosporosinus fructosivorans]
MADREKDLERPYVAAVILAAGYSFRMKSFKPLLPLGSVRVVEKAVHAFQEAAIQDIRVVLGHRANELLPVLEGLKVQSVINDNYAEGMFSSVKAGVKSLSQDIDGFFLLPVDNPIIQQNTLSELYQTFSTGKFGIVYPAFHGKRGHPPLISCRYANEILDWNGKGGLKNLLEYYEVDAVNVELEDRGVLMDMDTPEDYRKMLTYMASVPLPTEEECYKLLKMNNTPVKVIEHCKQVAGLSCWLGKQLCEAGYVLNLELLNTSAILHDIAKGKEDHARAGAEIMANYPEIAEIIASHMDIFLDATQAITEKEIVYLADKLVKNNRIILLQDRFKAVLKRFEGESQAQENIRQRFKNAQMIQTQIEYMLQKSLQNLSNLELRRDANG